MSQNLENPSLTLSLVNEEIIERSVEEEVNDGQLPATSHDTLVIYRCDLCGDEFLTVSLLKQHMDGHGEDKLPKSAESEQSFLDTSTVNSHPESCAELTTIAGESNRLINRKKRGKDKLPKHAKSELSFLDTSTVNSHSESCTELTMSTEESTLINQKKGCYQCTICDESFPLRRNLRSHMKTHVKIRTKNTKKSSKISPPKTKNRDISSGFTCNKCGERFSIRYELRKHTSIVHFGRKPHVCSQCGHSFFQVTHFKSHVKTHDKEKPQPKLKKVHLCEDCGEGFGRKRELKEHMKMHVAGQLKDAEQLEDDSASGTVLEDIDTLLDRPVVVTFCEICGKDFVSLSKLEVHRKKHEKNSLQCPNCDKKFSRRSNLRQHMETHKENGQEITEPDSAAKVLENSANGKNFDCKKCGECFAIPYELRKHIGLVHNGKSMHDCPECDRTFFQISHLKSHMKTHTKEKERLMVCDICGLHFGRKLLFLDHMKSHEKTDSSHCCTECDETFKYREDLECHLKFHNGKTLHVCIKCKRSFFDIQSLNVHMKFHEKETACKVCGVTFVSKSGLKKHMQSHTQKGQKTSARKRDETSAEKAKSNTDERPFACKKCTERFARYYDLRKHASVVHNGATLHICSECGRSFFQISHLRSHMKTHTREKRHECPACGESFAWKKDLDTHTQLHKGRRSRAKLDGYVMALPNESDSSILVGASGCNAVGLEADANGVNETLENDPTDIAVTGGEEVGAGGHENPMRKGDVGIGADKPNTATTGLTGSYGVGTTIKMHPKKRWKMSKQLPNKGQQQTDGFFCKKCDLHFAKRCELIKHRGDVHSGKSLYSCSECNKQFGQRSRWRTHMKTHTHAKKMKKHQHKNKFTCDKCEKNFSTDDLLKTHVSKVHSRSPYACSVCGKSFCRMSNLDNHKKTHAKVKTHVCSTCQADFSSKKELAKHVGTHKEMPSKDGDIMSSLQSLDRVLGIPLPEQCDRAASLRKINDSLSKNTKNQPGVSGDARKKSKKQFLLKDLLGRRSTGGSRKNSLKSLVFEERGASRNGKQRLPKHVDTIQDNTPTHMETIRENAPTHVETVQENAATHVETIQDNALTHVETIRENAPTHAETVQENAATQVETIRENAPTHVETIRENAPTHVGTIRENAPTHVETIRGNAPMHVETIHKNAGTHVETIRENAPTHVETVRGNAPTHVETIHKNAGTHVETIRENAPTHVETIRENAEEVLQDTALDSEATFADVASNTSLTEVTDVVTTICEICSTDLGALSIFETHVHMKKHEEGSLIGGYKRNQIILRRSSLRKQTLVEKEPSTVDLGQNLESNRVKNIFSCTKCDECFASRDDLRKHKRIVHNGRSPYVCFECGECFFLIATLRKHRKRHAVEETHICKECGACFACNKELAKHKVIHKIQSLESAQNVLENNQSGKSFSCKICGECFRSSYILRSHTRFAHKVTSQHVCSDCGKCFHLSSQLKRHAKIHRKEECDGCGASFEEKKDLVNHKKKCRKSASISSVGVKNAKENHSSNNHSSKLNICRKKECGGCGACFEEKGDLAKRRKVCQKKCRSNAIDSSVPAKKGNRQKRSHKQAKCVKNDRMVARDKRRGDYPCRKCDKRFPLHYLLRKHITFEHNGGTMKICPECGRQFYQSCHLKQHMKTHTKERNHICGECGEAFVLKKELIAHKKSHKPVSFSCTESGICCGNHETSIIGGGNCQEKCSEEAENHEMSSLVVENFQQKQLKEASSSQASTNVKNDLQELHEKPDNGEISASADGNYQQKQLEISENCKTATMNVTSPARTGHVCQKCGECFILRYDLRKHKSLVHNNKTMHVCSICGRSFYQISHLKKHAKTHTKESPYACKDCGESFAVKKELTSHRKTHQNNLVNGKYPCGRCEEQFTLLYERRKHISLVHFGKSMHVCSVCRRSFYQISHLKSHVRTHTKEKPYICEECGEQFTLKGELTSHQKMHRSVSVRYFCEICRENFASKHELESHKRSHETAQCDLLTQCVTIAHISSKDVDNGGRNEDAGESCAIDKNLPQDVSGGSFVCKKCNERFAIRYELRKHNSLVHQGKSAHVCDECGRKFFQISHLKSHIKTHKKMKRSHACEECGASFVWVKDLKKHKKLLHQNEQDIEIQQIPESEEVVEQIHDIENKFVCDDCGERFTVHYELCKHKNLVHGGESMWSCSQCGRVFFELSRLKTHEKSHAKDKLRTCPECGEGFRGKKALKRHAESHSKVHSYACSECGVSFSSAEDLTAHMEFHKEDQEEGIL